MIERSGGVLVEIRSFRMSREISEGRRGFGGRLFDGELELRCGFGGGRGVDFRVSSFMSRDGFRRSRFFGD